MKKDYSWFLLLIIFIVVITIGITFGTKNEVNSKLSSSFFDYLSGTYEEVEDMQP